MKTTIKAKLEACNDGIYKQFVFSNPNLDPTDELYYITVTMCPNWNYNEKLCKGDVGFLEYEYAEGGESYYNPHTNTYEVYKHTAHYFINFIKEKIRDNVKEFNF